MALVAFCLVPASAAQAQDRPSRIVSVNMCADQLLLALADRDQIAALSWNAPRPALSYFADKADGYDLTRGNAEDVIVRKPDLVLAGPFSGGPAKAAMRRAGLNVEELGIPGTPQAAADQLETFGLLIGQGPRGAALAGELRDAFAPREMQGNRKLRALYLQRRGIVTGRATMMDALMRAAGLENALEADGFARLDAERLATVDVDLLILDGQGLTEDGDAADQGAAMLAHPVLAARFPPSRRVVVPQAETVCPGPSLVRALERLREAAASVAPR
ncbi:ABC transporter substrate-binding protein [Tepidamorphus sp. 3E244]|uniref:ABC transporter substrate-binding protein n=1 Tax=Tepidamorphus sp. 3E244 TaxID=3385498 RepID=UPI0038FCA325